MIKRLLLAGTGFLYSFLCHAQEKWDLQKCVEFALKNNISVKQQDIQARYSALALKQSKAAIYPNLNFGSSAGFSFGLSDNPTTGVLENNNFFNAGMQLQSQVTLFNWFAKKRTIEADELTYQAETEQIRKIQNDIALNVAVAYLQVLLAKEQVNIVDVRIKQTASQLESTRKQVDAGKLPELNATQLESQLATDSSDYISAEGLVQQNLLQMKALLSLDAGTPFDIVTPPIEAIPVLPLAELQPEAVYASALANLPQQKVNQLRIASAQKSVTVAKAGLYPTISAFGSLATNYVHFKKRPVYEQVVAGYIPSGLRADAGGGVFYDVQRPVLVNSSNVAGYIKADAFATQFKNNFGQNIGINISVPIFNGRSARTAWERSKLEVKSLELTKQEGDLQLKQDIYKAYVDATTALQKFNANTKGLEASAKAYDFAKKRYDVGMLSTYELLISQATFQTAQLQLLYVKYDYIFKMKLLEFYKGKGLKLE